MTGYNSKRNMARDKNQGGDMTDLRQAAQQALEALIDAANVLSAPMFADAVDALKAALEQQAEPVAWNAGVAPMWPQQKEGETFSVSYTTTPEPEQQAEPPPEWLLIKNILDEYGLDAIAFVTAWKAVQQRAEPVQERITRIAWDERGVRTVNGIPDDAPQRPWVGLTDEDWAKVEDMPDTFDQGVAWAAARLKERNT